MNSPAPKIFHTPTSLPEPPKWRDRLGTMILLAAFGLGAGLWWAVLTRPAQSQDGAEVGGPAKLGEMSRDQVNEEMQSSPPGDMPEDAGNDTDLASVAFQPGQYRQGEMIIHASSPEELAAAIARATAAGGTVIQMLGELNAARLSFDTAEAMQNFVQGNPGQEQLQMGLNFTVSLPTEPPAPDPSAPSSMVPFGNSVMPYLGVPANNAAWGKGVMIAMLDTGLSTGDSNLLTGSGLVTQLNFVSGDQANPGHADKVASLIAGAQGEQGIAPAANLLSVRVLDNNNLGDIFTVANGIIQAVKSGAQVISLSLGTSQSSDVLQQAVNYALSQGVILVASAGNDGTGAVTYPAAYDGVIAVGSVDATGQRASFSNYGSQMDIAAPGVGINTNSAAGQQSFSGTSASAPLVAGAIASLISTQPGITPQGAVSLLTTYADQAGPVTAPGTNDYYGAGVMNLDRVLNRNNPGYADVAVSDFFMNLSSLSQLSVTSNAMVPLTVSIQNRGNNVVPQVQVIVDANGTSVSQTFVNITPRQVNTVVMQVPVAQLLSNSGVQVTAAARSLGGPPDANLNNNVLSRMMRVANPNPTGSATPTGN